RGATATDRVVLVGGGEARLDRLVVGAVVEHGGPEGAARGVRGAADEPVVAVDHPPAVLRGIDDDEADGVPPPAAGPHPLPPGDVTGRGRATERVLVAVRDAGGMA